MYARNVTLHIGRAHAREAIPAVLELIEQRRLDPAAVTTARANWDDADQALAAHVHRRGVKLVISRL